MSTKTNIIFLGNPGVGKSTLLNILIGAVHFKSGVNFVSGLTLTCQTTEINDTVFIDTPGLDDVHFRKQAAQEIQTALQYEEKYKIVFICTLESCRIKPTDMQAMQSILKAIHAKKQKLNYGIIFNKFSKAALRILDENAQVRKALTGSLNLLQPSTTNYFFYPNNSSLEDENNAIEIPSQEFKEFIDNLKPTYIENCSTIDVDNYEERIQELQQQLNVIRNQ